MANKTTFIEIKDLQTVIKAFWNHELSVYEITCGNTYIGRAESIEAAEPTFRKWFNNLTK